MKFDCTVHYLLQNNSRNNVQRHRALSDYGAINLFIMLFFIIPADDEAYNDSADDGSDSDFEDIPYPSSYVVRDDDPDLPDTVTKLTSLDGCKVYLVGTAHFSQSSQDDVAKVTRDWYSDWG